MNAKSILKGVLKSAISLLDSDQDGRLEIEDVPGAIANIATMKMQGQALVSAAGALFGGIKDAAGAGNVTSNGVPVTAEQVAAAWDAAYVPFKTAADEARAAEPPESDVSQR